MTKSSGASGLAIAGLMIGLLALAAVNVSMWIDQGDTAAALSAASEEEARHREQVQKSLTALEKRLEALSARLAAGPGLGATATSRGGRDPAIQAETLARLEAAIARLETMSRAGAAGFGDAAKPPQPPTGFPPLAGAKSAAGALKGPEWFSNLSSEKQARVKQAFREHAEYIRTEMSYEPNPAQVPPGRLHEIMEDSQNFLLDRLSGILEPAELEEFVQDFQSPRPMLP